MPIADAIMAPLPTDYICPRQQRRFNTQFSPQSSPILWLLQLEQERRRRETEALAVQTPEAAAAAAAVRARAELLLREQRDEVKRMNQMVLYSKCAVERDAQVSAAKVMPTLTYERNIRARHLHHYSATSRFGGILTLRAHATLVRGLHRLLNHWHCICAA